MPVSRTDATSNLRLGIRDEAARRQRRLFRWLAVGLALLPFLLAELALRVVENPAPEAVDLDPVGNWFQSRPLFQFVPAENSADAAGVGRWEIPSERMNFFRPASFAAPKPPGTRRVFVLGGSTVQGRPYATETAFSTWLRFRLEADRDAGDFEVVNCGGVSYASYRVARILQEVLQHQPDAIVLYTGHNEYLEDRSYEKVRSMGDTQRLVDRLGSRSALVRWIRRQGRAVAEPASQKPAAPGGMSAEVDALLDHAGGLERYRRDPAYRQRIVAEFETTLRAMVAMTEQARVPLILCVPASDLMNTPPFKIETDPALSPAQRRQCDAAWEIARDAGQPEAVRRRAGQRCLQIDPRHAGAHFVLGSLLATSLANGQPASTEQAVQHLTAARDYDVCPLRATSSILAAIRRVAADRQIPIVEVEPLSDRRSLSGVAIPDGLPDPEWFVDHVHPAIHGHQQIAEAIADQFQSLGWIRQTDATEKRYQTRAAVHLQSLGEAYFQRGRQRLEGLRQWAQGRSSKAGTAMPRE